MTQRMSGKKVRSLNVLVASPGDVAEERKIAEEVIRNWHVRHPESGLRLDPVLWESHAAPDSCDRVQGILNSQIVDQCYFAVGIFWTRIGTHTGVAPGGAVEEVQRLMGNRKPVMIYFSNVPYRRRDVDLEQIRQLDDFRESLRKNSLVWEFDDRSEFRELFVRHFDLQVPRWFAQGVDFSEKIAVQDGSCDADLIRYQSTLQQKLGDVNLSGSPAIESFSVRLSDTFVSLSLSDSWRSEKRYQHEREAECEQDKKECTRTPEEVMSLVFKNHRLLLVIGDPGSGKTTLLKYYALSCLQGDGYKPFGFIEPVVVFYLPLCELKQSESGYASLPANLSSWAEKQFLTLSEARFSGWLEESSTLVLLDGLDEISDVKQRIAVCSWIDRTIARFAEARFVVTSRSTGYRKGDGIEIETRHVRADIMDFSKDQQAEFLQKWFRAAYMRELPPGSEEDPEWQSRQAVKASQKADAITAFLVLEKNTGLRSMAGVPLLLQIMAMLWKDREFLPATRVELYDAALNYLLDYRDRRRGIEPLLAAKDARRVLSPVSLWMQDELKKDEAPRDAMQQKMQTLLDTLYNGLGAEPFCRNLVDRAGLLVEYGESEYVFRHKSFREYMAGFQLVKNLYQPGSLDSLVTHFGDDWWQEVLRFFIGHVDDAGIFDAFMEKLFDSPVTETLTQKQQDLLVTLIQDAPQKKIDALQKKLLDPNTTPNRQHYLLAAMKAFGDKSDAFTAAMQFEEQLARENDISIKLDKLGAQYIFIKGGAFRYSLTGKTETVRDCDVAKFTVTNQHYRRFITYLEGKDALLEAMLPLESYSKRLFTLAKRIKGFLDYLKQEKNLSILFRSSRDGNKQFNKDDQPVVGVIWYAAKAYCLWLSLLESDDESLYRLPREIEWEYAAAGEEGRKYPWGEAEPTSKRANYNNNEGTTTPVGRYPDGATPEGLYDMAGNVWEWTDSWYDDDQDLPALRGGAYHSDNTDVLRCSSRGGGSPDGGADDDGFRVIRPSHSSSS